MLAFVVRVPPDEVELAADVLWALGVVAVEERSVGADDSAVELWTSVGDGAGAVDEAARLMRSGWQWRTEEIDAGVADSWRAFAQPTWVDDGLVVVPAWIPFAPPAASTALRIEPGATFGLGDHPTTLLTLRALRAVLTPGAAVLDVGCGSGVLSVAAAMLGAGTVRAIDIAAASVPTTEDNATRNGVGGRIDVSTTPLHDVDGRFDVVLANILAPALVELAADLRRVLAPSGRLVISGVLAHRHAHVLDALDPLRPIAAAQLDGWAAITLAH